jgi:hypothetical protein
MELSFDHYECECGYIFCIEETSNLIYDAPCPRCSTPISLSFFVKARKEKVYEA